MPQVVKNVLTTTAAMSALCLFFAFASNRWIDNVEGQINRLSAAGEHRSGQVAELSIKYVELNSRMATMEESLRRIERNLDKLLSRECTQR